LALFFASGVLKKGSKNSKKLCGQAGSYLFETPLTRRFRKKIKICFQLKNVLAKGRFLCKKQTERNPRRGRRPEKN